MPTNLTAVLQQFLQNTTNPNVLSQFLEDSYGTAGSFKTGAPLDFTATPLEKKWKSSL